MSQPAVLLDKDGTLIEDVPYSVALDRLRLLPGVAVSLQRLQAAGFALVVVSNQSGLAHGFFNADALEAVAQRLRAMLNVNIAGFYWCPHHPAGRIAELACACECRKPAPGLLLRAARELDLDLARSWMVGDILNDVEAGRRAGCRTILLDNGNETEWVMNEWRQPDAIVRDWHAVTELILHS